MINQNVMKWLAFENDDKRIRARVRKTNTINKEGLRNETSEADVPNSKCVRLEGSSGIDPVNLLWSVFV